MKLMKTNKSILLIVGEVNNATKKMIVDIIIEKIPNGKVKYQKYVSPWSISYLSENCCSDEVATEPYNCYNFLQFPTISYYFLLFAAICHNFLLFPNISYYFIILRIFNAKYLLWSSSKISLSL